MREEDVKRLPPLGSIQAFVQVARQGSVKSAAEALALSSPALTRRIQSLEQFVGAPLFERHHNAVRLNDRGDALLAEVEPHLDALALAMERATDEGRTMRIRIAVPSLFAAQRLVPALPSLKARHPNLLVDVVTSANQARSASEGIDASIAITDSVDERQYARLLETGRVVAIGPARLAQGGSILTDPADLYRMTILLHRRMPRAFDAWRNAMGLPNLRPAQVSYFDAGQLILDAAAEGLGIAFMLESHLRCSTDTRLSRVFDQSAESPYAYWFICQHSALARRGVRIFHDWLLESFESPVLP